MRVAFSELAKQELEDAAQYYELEDAGLGRRFKAEVKSAARRIARYPRAWPLQHGEIRKCSVYKFPYNLLYAVEGDHVLVIAVAHQHRRPEYWVERIDS